MDRVDRGLVVLVTPVLTAREGPAAERDDRDVEVGGAKSSMLHGFPFLSLS